MPEPVTLNLPDDIASIARAEAIRSARPLDLVLLDWIRRGGQDELTTLTDDDLLAVCDSKLPAEQQTKLSELQALAREGALSEGQSRLLSDLLSQYQSGLLRKARAWQIAVQRGLRSLAGST